ncbi:MAG TPA: DMT family transporter, partial [Chloroflexota bacterium]|nr:DMT family transporter [Chloroflexota bacterium]
GRRVTPGADPMTLASLASGAAVPVLLTLVLLNGGLTPILGASLHVKLLLLWVGVGCTALNYSLWFYALQKLPAARAAPFQYLIPPVGVALSALTLGDAITPALLLGGGLIVFGLVASQIATGTLPAERPRLKANEVQR